MNSVVDLARGRLLLLLPLGMLVAIAGALPIHHPGYMDAEYYFATAGELSSGSGLSEPFLWNYLDDPAGLPHPSHRYWMPLTTFLAAAGTLVFGDGFRAAQAVFVFMAGALPYVTARIALHLNRRQGDAWLAGLLACAPGFYLPFLLTSDTFTPFAILGAGVLWGAAQVGHRPTLVGWLVLGILAGLGHLTRADGILLLAPILLVLFRFGHSRWLALAAVLMGYTAIMAPWFVRNLQSSGVLLSPGVGRGLWLLRYDELFSYPADILTSQRWLESGLGAILDARLRAAWSNLQSLVAVNGLVFLFPLMLMGIWRMRREILVQCSMAYLVVLVLAMTVVFPFAGMRGGLFHSSVALMPVLWSLTPTGLEAVVQWGSRRRGWDARQAKAVFGSAAVLLAVAMTAAITSGKLSTGEQGLSEWSMGAATYEAVGGGLAALDRSDPIVAVNNPPGFTLATGLRAVVIPDGPPETLQAVVRRYGVSWVVLEQDHPVGLEALYTRPEQAAWLELEEVLLDVRGRRVLLLRVTTTAGES